MTKRPTTVLLVMVCVAAAFLAGCAEIKDDAQKGELKLINWQPKSQLVVKETQILKPKFPVIDIHNHLGRKPSALADHLQVMDEVGVWECVSLDARSAEDFYKKHLGIAQSLSRQRFLLFFAPDFSKIDDPDFGLKEAQKLEEAVNMGIYCSYLV